MEAPVPRVLYCDAREIRMNDTSSLVIRGNKIFEDSHGHICLDDLWRAAKAKPSKEPPRWRVTQGAKALIEELQKKTVVSGLKENRPDMLGP
jgi:hypothetical protein